MGKHAANRMALVMLAAALTVAGCGSGSDGENSAGAAATGGVTNSASPSASATPTKADKEPPNPDNFFWVTYKVGVPKSDLLPKVSAIKAAKAVCRLFEGGWTMDNFGAEGYLKDDSNVWHIGSAVQAYCPKFKDALLD